jgi:hypothetical protein
MVALFVPSCLFNSIQIPTDMLSMLYLLIKAAYGLPVHPYATLQLLNASGNTISSNLSAHLVVQLGMLVSYNIYSSLNLLHLTDAPGSHSPYRETQR